MSPSECAAREALEEAGVVGEVAARPLGTFQHSKQLKNGKFLPLHVKVFVLEVVQQRRTWIEKGSRETCWCSLDEVLSRVSEPGLRRLIVKFAKEHTVAV